MRAVKTSDDRKQLYSIYIIINKNNGEQGALIKMHLSHSLTTDNIMYIKQTYDVMFVTFYSKKL